ncbi:hypothetical protein ABZ470_02485 [Streptosporangium sp. NPDC020072]|uniref:hypothetical protein n=1 Tax=Streptosporangium sp. NPDC020072 TaxID=3154788 RepID=UPI003425E546
MTASNRPQWRTATRSAKGVVANSSKIISSLEKGARLAPTLWAGVAIAGTAVANVPGMADAYNNWESIHSRLDTLNKSFLASLRDKEKDGWIAKDREAFNHAVQQYQEAVESLRAYVKAVAGIVDELGDAYRAYWAALAALAARLISLLLIAAAMLTTPFAGSAMLNLRMLGTLASSIIGASTAALVKIIAAGASSVSLFFSGKAFWQMFNLSPTGAAKIDFTQAMIVTGNLPSFQKPPPSQPGQPTRLPPSAGFQWLAPKRELPAP